MEYARIQKGRFLSRPNRFIARVETEGQTVDCHVKNTGRCRELLVEGAEVYLARAPEGAVRKTLWDLVAVQKGERLINMDAQAPNQAAAEWIASGEFLKACGSPGEKLLLLRPECQFGDSRFDFYLETTNQKGFLEVKGVTLEENGTALFPDAPTQRGVKHLEGLVRCMEAGYRAYLLFVIQMKDVRCFRPNQKMHPAFAEALRIAQDRGVTLLARDCLVRPQSMELQDPVAIQL